MNLKPLSHLIGLTDDELVKEMAPVRERQIKAQAELHLSQIDGSLINLERNVHELCAKKDVNIGAIIDKLDEIDLLERRKRRYAEVMNQLFPK